MLTKPDLVDEGGEGEVIKVLKNQAKPLLHGYFMVKNRAQKELDNDKKSEDAGADELKWLQSSKYAVIPGIGASRRGVPALTTALTNFSWIRYLKFSRICLRKFILYCSIRSMS